MTGEVSRRVAFLRATPVTVPASGPTTDARDVAALPGGQQAGRFLRFGLIAVRVLNLSTSLLALVTRAGSYRLPVVVVLLYLGVAAWSYWLFGTGTAGGMVGTRHAAADVTVAAVCLAVVGRLCDAHYATDWTNWSFAYALAVSMVAGAVFRLAVGIGCAAALAAVYLTAVLPAVTDGRASLANGIGNAVSFVGFAVVAWAVARHVRTTGADLDHALARALAAEATQARAQERTTQYRTLHNTVLATLTAIARGGLDHRTEVVRRRCAREADYLRHLLEEEHGPVDRALRSALLPVISRAEENGLRVRLVAGDVPRTVPGEVADAFAGAVEEALENVRRHSGALEARVTATADPLDPDVLTVRVVDRGTGFDPATARTGFGTVRSIAERMADAGGRAEITSHPGEGTIVELQWPSR